VQRLEGPALVATEPTGVDESAYRTIVDAVAQVMWVNDAEGGVRFFNRFGTEYMGRTNAELEGRQWLAYIHDEDRERLRAARSAAIVEGVAYSVDGRFRRHDGEYRWQCFDVQPVRAADGTIVAWIGSARDVHEERAREAAREATERVLAEREERLRAALDASRTGTFRWDIRTDALDWDANLDRLFGLEPGRTARSLDQFVATVHADDRDRVIAACVRCAASGADFDEEFRVVWPDGTIRWLHDKGRTYRDAGGRPVYMTGACVDVTDARRRQEELHALAETMPQLVWMADATGHVHYFNARWEEYTGLTAAQLSTGGEWPGTVHEDDAPMMRQRWSRSIATGEPYEIVYRLRRADGAYRWFVGRAAPSLDEGGRVVRWFGSCTDIDDEVLVRERLQRLNAVTEALAGARDVPSIGRVVADEGITALGAAAGRLSVLAADGRTLELHDCSAIPPEMAARWRRFPLDAPVPMATAACTGEPLYLASLDEVVARFPSVRDEVTRLRFGALAVLPLEWDGARLGAISFDFRAPRTFDADTRAFLETLARQCAQALERARLFALEQRARRDAEAARVEAQRANVAKGEFLAMMSHDLRTPINATLGYLDLMALEIRGPLTTEQQHDVERMQRSQRALLALVNEVLDYTRVEAGRADCRRDPLPLGAVVSDVVPIVEALAAQKGLRFEAAPVPELVAIGDADRVRQVLLNLLSNAVKFTDAGGTVRLVTEGDASVVRVRVRDTGRGIAPEALASVFEPFVQLAPDRDRTAREGIGLGLAIARELARAMDGDLTAESVAGEGSTFTLELPRG
jgi:PAS domain S-box-containing protein